MVGLALREPVGGRRPWLCVRRASSSAFGRHVGLAARRIPGSFPRRKVLTWLLIAYLGQSIWLMPVRLLQGESWRAFPGQVVGIAR